MTVTDLDFGMFGFRYPGKAVGGKIKTFPEDFVVIEVDKEGNPIPRPPAPLEIKGANGGLFLLGRVWRKDRDHARMIRVIAKAFKVSEQDISTAGIKDARAEVVQLFSVYDPKKQVSDPIMLDDGIEIGEFRWVREPLYPGQMGGNFFDILIREHNPVTQEELHEFQEWAENGILNYYGYQRFGSHRPITAQLGRAYLNEDYEKMIDLYLGGKSSGADEVYRKHWRENKDPDELMTLWVNIPETERILLKYLSRRSRHYRGAVAKLPKFLINISVSAFVSLLFNYYLSIRGDSNVPLKGEREKDGNIEIALPSSLWIPKGPLNEYWEEIFKKFEVTEKELKKIRPTTRELFIYPKYTYLFLDDEGIRVQFQLKPGQYATTVLRELMQQPPEYYF